MEIAMEILTVRPIHEVIYPCVQQRGDQSTGRWAGSAKTWGPGIWLLIGFGCKCSVRGPPTKRDVLLKSTSVLVFSSSRRPRLHTCIRCVG